jgi:hypothetical protein
MRVERERELRRRRTRREKARKARRKAELTRLGKWPPAPVKA